MSSILNGTFFFYTAAVVGLLMLIWKVFFERRFLQLTKTPEIKCFVSDCDGHKVISFAKLSLAGVQWTITYTPRDDTSPHLKDRLIKEIPTLASYDRKIAERVHGGRMIMMEHVNPKITGKSWTIADDIYRYQLHSLKAVEPPNDRYIRLSGVVIIRDYQDKFFDRIDFQGIPLRYLDDLTVLQNMLIWLFHLPLSHPDLFGTVTEEPL